MLMCSLAITITEFFLSMEVNINMVMVLLPLFPIIVLGTTGRL